MTRKEWLESKMKIVMLATELNLMRYQRNGQTEEEYKYAFDLIHRDAVEFIGALEPKHESEVM